MIEYIPSLNLIVIKSILILIMPVIYFVARKRLLRSVSYIINAYFLLIIIQNFNSMTIDYMPDAIWFATLFENIFSIVLISISFTILFYKRKQAKVKEELIDSSN